MKKFLGFLILGLLLGGITTVSVARYQYQNQEVHFHEHADFALFLNGQKFDFSKDKYMSVKPCIAQHSDSLIADYFLPKAQAHGDAATLEDAVHLHDNKGDVIHVHKEGIRYHDFFASLGMEFTDETFVDDQHTEYRNDETNSFRFFVNGEEVETIAEREIRDLDQVVITYGPRDRSQESIQLELARLTNDACLSSGTCAHRGLTTPENCGGVVKKPFLLKWIIE